MFGTDDPVRVATLFDDYKETLEKSLDTPKPWGYGGPIEQAPSGFDLLQKGLASADVSKAISPETIEAVRNQLANTDINKDLALASPLATGLVAFDLEAPSKKLFPRETKIRNRIPRKKGIGTSHRFKVISGITGSQTGVSDLYPGISESTTTSFGSVNYLRGPKISYAGYDVAVPYSQFSLSDQVSWAAQFAGEGFEDIRQLSQTSVLYASMLEEEKMIISGRGTGSGFLGALPALTGITLTARTAAGTESALTGFTTNVYVKVTADAGPFGQSVLSSAANVGVSAGQVVDVTVSGMGTAPGMRVYVSTGASDPGDAARWYAGRTASNVFTLQGALPTSGVAASTVVADTSAYAAGFDGIVATCLGPNSGYVSRVNGTFNAANPGNEFFKAFDTMYQNNGADPDEILFNGSDRRALSDLLKTSSSSNYQIMVQNQGEAHSAQIGALVTGLQNETTGKMVGLSINRYMPQGVCPIVSWTLPLPDSNVSDVWEMRLVQDYMGIQWPVNQFAYECSSYWYGTLICPAPQWNGAVTGVKLT
jgi:hypothetical protein